MSILTIILPIIIAIIIFLALLKLINKFILKNKVQINLKEIIIGWSIIFCFNLFCVIFDIPCPIGITYSPFFDGGQTKFCASLGYVITIEKNTIIPLEGEDITTKVDFLTLNRALTK